MHCELARRMLVGLAVAAVAAAATTTSSSTTLSASTSTITAAAVLPIELFTGPEALKRSLGQCGFATGVDCCQSQAPWFCPTQFGSCYTTNRYVGCCTRSGGCAPRAKCYPYASQQACDPDLGGCTACNDASLPFCATETNLGADQYIVYCASEQTYITHSYTLDAAQISRGAVEESSRTRRSTTLTSTSRTSTASSSAATPTPTPTPTSLPASTSLPGSGGKSHDKAGPIAGGVIGGLVVLALIGTAIFFGYRHYRKTHPSIIAGKSGRWSSRTDGSSQSKTDATSISPYGWHNMSPQPSQGYAPVDGPDRINGSPSPTLWPKRYGHDSYGDPQHPGYLPIGPLTVRNSATPRPSVDTDRAELEGESHPYTHAPYTEASGFLSPVAEDYPRGGRHAEI